jgi:hypothetical protein
VLIKTYLHDQINVLRRYSPRISAKTVNTTYKLAKCNRCSKDIGNHGGEVIEAKNVLAERNMHSHEESEQCKTTKDRICYDQDVRPILNWYSTHGIGGVDCRWENG